MDNSKHLKTKKVFKILGISLLSIGTILALIGFIDFFVSINTSDMPHLFFLCMIGLPLIGVGLMFTLTGFRHEISSYVVQETAPITNEMSEAITPAVQNIAAAAKEGFEKTNEIRCSCGKYNEENSKFCGGCGKPLAKVCPACHKQIDGDNSFCNHCGTKLP